MYSYDITWEYSIDGQPADGLYEADNIDDALAFINELAVDPEIGKISLVKHL